MSKRPQFRLKAILVIVAVLSVPMRMFASGHRHTTSFAYYTSSLADGGSLGHLAGGWKYAFKGVSLGASVYAAIPISSTLRLQ